MHASTLTTSVSQCPTCMQTGLQCAGREGQTYRPSVVRVGLKPHHSVHKAALDTLIDKRMSTARESTVSLNVCSGYPMLHLAGSARRQPPTH